MMGKRRLYFLVPKINTTKNIVDELLVARIPEKHIHVIAKEGVLLENLPEASLLEKSDFIPALEKGLSLGGVTGILARAGGDNFTTKWSRLCRWCGLVKQHVSRCRSRCMVIQYDRY